MSRRVKNRYFNKQPTTPSGSSDAVGSLNAVFDQFREASDPADTIGINGTMAYLQALGVGLEEPTALVIAELLKAPAMGEFSREGFVDGWRAQNVDSLSGMKSLVPSLRQSYQTDEAFFKRIYLFTFNYARTPPQKSLSLDIATAYWQLLLAGRFDAHLPAWIEFLETSWKKSIAKDTWNCMYDFVQFANRNPALDEYDVNGAWPSILDDFVEFYRKKNSMDIS